MRRVGDHLDDVRACVALLAGELDELSDFAAHLALLWGADHPDAAPRAHFEQSFVAQGP